MGAAVGGAFLKQIGGISSMGMGHFGGNDRGSNNLTLTGALQEAASSNVGTIKNMGTAGGNVSAGGNATETDRTTGFGGGQGQGPGGQMLHENDEESATLVVRYTTYHIL